MAFTFLRQRLKRNPIKSPDKDIASQPISPAKQEPLADPIVDNGSMVSEAVSDVVMSTENTLPPEEQDSGYSGDCSSDFSRQESSESSMDKELKSDGQDPTSGLNCAEADFNSIMQNFDEDLDNNSVSDQTEFSQEIRERDCADDDLTETLTSDADLQDNLTITEEDQSSSLISAIPGEVSGTEEGKEEEELMSLSRLKQDDDFVPETSYNFEASSRISLAEIQSPTVPPPPPLPLDLRGDHTTSSTTDSLTKNTTLNGATSNENKDLINQIQTASQQMTNSRKMSLNAEAFSVPTSRRISETINDDIKAVIISRQKRAESNADYELTIPRGKATIYKARIGEAPEDTELGRLFRKRAEKLGHQSVESEDDGKVKDQENDEVSTHSLSLRQDPQSELVVNENCMVIEEREENEINSDDETIQQTSVHELDIEEYAEEEGTVSCEPTEHFTMSQTTIDNNSENDYFTGATQCSQEEITRLPDPDHQTNEDDLDAIVEDLDDMLLDSDSSPRTTEDSNSSPELSSSSSGVFVSMDSDTNPSSADSFDPNSPDSFNYDEVLSVFDDLDDEVITNSTQTIQEHSKILHSKVMSQPLDSFITPTVTQNEHSSTEFERKKHFSFKNVFKSLGKNFGRTKKTTEPEQRTDAEVSKMKFDDNWSIHDTITENRGKNSDRSLQNVFENIEVRSFSEFVDPEEKSRKDFSVRNWREVLENSEFTDGPDNLTGQNDEDSTFVTERIQQTRKRSNSSPSSGGRDDSSLGPDQGSSNGHTSGKFKKSKSRAEILDESRSNRSTTGSQRSRMSSMGLNSTLPSRRNHEMMQSLDSIFPQTQPFGQQQRLYQKRYESDPKYSLPAQASNAVLSPVIRRWQKSQNDRK